MTQAISAPKVSVAIATYNRARMVREAVEAAQAQTLAPIEIVVTDDASTDDTWGTLQQLAAADPRVKPVRQETNTGGVENWNAAVRHTTGDYIAWCSDDDRFLPDHLASAIAVLEQNPSIGFTHASFVDSIETDSAIVQTPRPLRFGTDQIISRNDLLSYMTRFYDWPFHPSTIVMRRAVFEQVGPFDPTYALADTDWFVRAVERFPAAMLARHSVLNRRHPGNWSNRVGSAKMQNEIFSIVEQAIYRLHADSATQRLFWKTIWRNNVRARLLLTMIARVRSGHGEAACAAWREILRGTGRTAPDVLVHAGETLLRWGSRRQVDPSTEGQKAPQSVSPL